MAETIEDLLFAIASPVVPATKAFTGISQYAAASPDEAAVISVSQVTDKSLQDQLCNTFQALQASSPSALLFRILHGDCTASLARKGTYQKNCLSGASLGSAHTEVCGAGGLCHLVIYRSCMACSRVP